MKCTLGRSGKLEEENYGWERASVGVFQGESR